jgi:hypothetical protein
LKSIERTDGLSDPVGLNGEIASRGVEVLVTEQHLDGAQVGAGLQEMCCEGMSQRVWRDLAAESSILCGSGDCVLNGTDADVSAMVPPREEPRSGPVFGLSTMP